MTFDWKTYLDSKFRPDFGGAIAMNLNFNADYIRKKMDDAAAADVAACLRRNSVVALRLENHNIGAEGAKALAAALPFSNDLKLLNLAYNPIGDAGATALAETLPRSALTNLYLTNCGINDQGAMALITALPDTNITQLSIMGGNEISAGLIGQIQDILAKNRERGEIARPLLPVPAPTTIVNTAEIIERQRKAALEDGQGI